jgi:hypothetical protein
MNNVMSDKPMLMILGVLLHVWKMFVEMEIYECIMNNVIDEKILEIHQNLLNMMTERVKNFVRIYEVNVHL